MSHGICPYWLGYVLRNPLRRLWHNPDEILLPFVDPGMTVLDIGSAMGFFAVPLAGMVGPQGKVVCVDVQEKMLQSLQKRATKAHVSERIITRVCMPASLSLNDFNNMIDFAIAFAVVHEVPDARSLFEDIYRLLRPGGRCLIAEPKGHVSEQEFRHTLAMAEQANLRPTGGPKIIHCHTAVLKKGIEGKA